MTSRAEDHAARAAAGDGAQRSPRQRLLDAATELFYREGIHSVGIDRVIEQAQTTRATMYKQFAGKEGLVVAYLEGEDERLRALFSEAAEVTGGTDAAGMLDAVIVGVEDDIRHRHTRGCPFINAAAEYPDDGPVRRVIDRHRAWFRGTLAELAGQAGFARPEALAASLVLLRDAALVGGYLDGRDAVAPVFAATARLIVEAHRG